MTDVTPENAHVDKMFPDTTPGPGNQTRTKMLSKDTPTNSRADIANDRQDVKQEAKTVLPGNSVDISSASTPRAGINVFGRSGESISTSHISWKKIEISDLVPDPHPKTSQVKQIVPDTTTGPNW